MGDTSTPGDESTAPPSPQPSSSNTWDESVVHEYDARVEPFTMLFVEELLADLFDEDNLRGKKTLLDVGCGTGGGTLLAAHDWRMKNITATDVSSGMIQHLQERISRSSSDRDLNIQCLVADGLNLSESVPHHHYDYALAAFSIIFFPSPLEGLRQVYQCLKNGGKVAMSAWGDADETPAFQIFPQAFRAIRPDLANEAKPKRITGSRATLVALLEEAGFNGVKVVGPIARNVQVASSQAFYDRFALTSPNIRGFLAQLSTFEREQVHAKVLELAEAQGLQEDGSICIPASAYLAYGVKRER